MVPLGVLKSLRMTAGPTVNMGQDQGQRSVGGQGSGREVLIEETTERYLEADGRSGAHR